MLAPNEERLTALRAMPYEDYLRTPEWRRRRNRALMIAWWRCQWPGCTQRVGLQVHHRSYEHLGDERDHELQVLCAGHHGERHAQLAAYRVHFRIIRDAMNAGPFASLADFIDLVKCRFSELRIPIRVRDLDDLIGVVLRQVPLACPTWPVWQPRGAAPLITEAQAIEILEALGTLSLIRTMPGGDDIRQETPEEFAAARARAWEMGIELD